MINNGGPRRSIQTARQSIYNRNTPLRISTLSGAQSDYEAEYSPEQSSDYILTPQEYAQINADYEVPGERTSGQHDIIDTWRTFVKKLAQGKKNNDERDILDIREQIDAANRVDEYTRDLQKLDILQDELEDGLANGIFSTDEIQRRVNEINKLKSDIDDAETFFKTDGRKYDVVVDNMFSKNVPEGFIDAAGRLLTRNNFDYKGTYEDPLFGTSVIPTPANVGRFAANALSTIATALRDITGVITEPDYYAKSYIKNAKNGDPNIEKMFVRPQKTTAAAYVRQDNERLNDALQAYAEDMDFYQNGNYRPLKFNRGLLSYVNPNIDWSVNIADVQSIDPVYTKQQEENAGNLFWHPLYTIAELGSSMSLVEGMLGSIGANKTYGYIARKLPGLILDNTVGRAGKVIRGAVTVADLLTQLGFARYSRELETGQEAEDAYTGRVLNALQKQEDGGKAVLQDIKNQLNQIGVDTKGLQDGEIIGAGLAYDIKVDTGERELDSALKDAKKGLDKLINQNNALAYSDYVETLPWLSQGGAVARFFGRTLGTAARGASAAAWSRLPGKTGEFVRDLRAANYTITPETREFLSALYGSKITKAAAKLMAKDAPQAAMKFLRVMETLGSIGEKMAASSVMESLEEGNQHLLQQRYTRGEYDDYDKPQSAFSIPEVFNNIAMYKDAIGNFLGINYGDPDNDSKELRKAMLIGAALGPIFGTAGLVASNVTPGENASIRNLISQMKTDRALTTLLGETYGQLQDEEHIGIFFDAINRAGRKPEQIVNTLRTYRNIAANGGNQDISPDFVDRDIQLLTNTASLYENEDFVKLLGELNIPKGSAEHRRAVQIGARALTDFTMALEQQSQLVDDAAQWRQTSHGIIDAVLEGQDDYVQDRDNYQLIKTGVEFILKKLYTPYTTQFAKLQKEESEKYIKNLNGRKNKDLLNDKEFLRFTGLDTEEFSNKSNAEKQNYISKNRDKLIRKARAAYHDQLGSKRIDKGDFVKRVYSLKEDEVYLQELLNLRDTWKAQTAKNNVASELLGVDINVDKAEGVVRALDKMIDQTAAKIRKDGSNYINIGDWDLRNSKLSDLLSFDLAEEDTLRDVLQKHALQSALIPTVSERVTPFISGYSNPDVLSENESGDYLDLLSAQRHTTNMLNALKDDKSEEAKVERKKLQDELKDVKRKTALKYLRNELKNDKLRQRIAHRAFLDDIQGDQSVVDAAENGDADAVTQLETGSAVSDEEDSIIKPDEDIAQEAAERAEKSEARKKASQLVYGDQYTQEDLERDRKKRQELEAKEEQEPFTIKPNISVEIDGADATDEEIDEARRAASELPITHYGDIEDGDVILKARSKDGSTTEYVTARVTTTDNGNKKHISTESWILSDSGVTEVDDVFPIHIPDTHRVVQGSIDGAEATAIEVNLSNGSITATNGDQSAVIENVNRPAAAQDPENVAKPADGLENQPEALQEQEVVAQEDEFADEKAVSDSDVEDVAEGDTGETQEEVSTDILNGDEYAQDISQPASQGQEGEYIADQPYSSDEEYIQDNPSSPEEEYIQERLRDLIDSGYSDPNDAIKQKNKSTTTSSTVAKAKYVDSTFFYQPDADEPMIVKIGKTPVKFKEGYTVRTGRELSEKLSTKGWADSETVDKYFIVTSPIDGKSDQQDPDQFSVILVYEDSSDKSIYMAAMRTIRDAKRDLLSVGTGGIEEVDDVYREAQQSVVANYYRRHSGEEGASEGIPRGGAARREYSAKMMHWYHTLKDQNLKDQIDDDVRKTVFGSDVLGIQSYINPKLETLRKNRMAIIDAVLPKRGGKYIFDSAQATRQARIRPIRLGYSNGKFNKTSEFANLNLKNNVFGFGDDVESIQHAIDSGSVHFAVGRGKHSEYRITDLYDDSIEYDGIGVAGKIFIAVDGLMTSDIPMLLWEQRFNRQHKKDGTSTRIKQDNPDSISLQIDPVTDLPKPNSNTLPSAAEVILYLLTNKVSTSMIPDNRIDLKVLDALKSIIFHEVSYEQRPVDAADETVSDKEMYFNPDERGGTIHLRINRRPVSYTLSQLFQQTPESESLRKQVALHIAKNIHWNTELNHGSITNSLHEEYPELSLALQHYFRRNPDKSSFSLYGVPEFTFYKEDLFDEKLNRKQNISMLAMMIKNGKLQTNVDVTRIFDRPFIYFDGVQNTATSQVLDDVHQSEKPQKPETDQVQVEERPEVSSIANARIKDLIDKGYRKDKAQMSDLFDMYSQSPDAKRHGGITDIVLFDFDKKADPQDTIARINEQIGKRGLSLNVIDGVEYGMSSQDLIVGYVYADKSITVIKMRLSEFKNTIRSFSEVYSTHNSGGKLNIDRTRKWISEKLGLPADSVLIDPIINSSSSEEVFGVMRVACDILGRDNVQIAFNPDTAGRGVGYHEAWHYINLLVHSKAQRQAVYKEYRKLNPDADMFSDAYIEELLAEDFRRWAEMKNENNLSNIIRRSWNRILDFMHIQRKSNAIYEIFSQIQAGVYAEKQIDKQSLEEFKEAYSGIVNSIDYYPGAPKNELKKLKYINDPAIYGQVRDAIVNGIMTYFNLSTIEQIKNQTDRFFEEYINHLKKRLEREINPVRASVLRDVTEHPLAFKTAVIRKFEEYGIRPRLNLNRVQPAGMADKQDIQESKEFDNSDNNENVWDRDGFDISRHENVRYAAKLFLSTIPVKEYDEESQTYINTVDPLLGEPIVYGFGEAFNTAIEELWMCDSFDEQIETESGETQLSPSSILYKVQTLAAAKNRFFVALLEKIEELDDSAADENIKTQLYNALVSQKSNIGFIGVRDKDPAKSKNTNFTAADDVLQGTSRIVDTSRYINISTENAISADFKTLSEWGSNFAQSGIIRAGKVNKPLLSELREKLEDVKHQLYRVIKSAKKNKKLSDNLIEETVENIPGWKRDIIYIANEMGIPLDIISLNDFLSNYRSGENTENVVVEVQAMYDAINKSLSRILTQAYNGNKLLLDAPQAVFKQRSNLKSMRAMARSYLRSNPSSIEFSQIDPSGKRIYAYGENNQFSDMLRDLLNNRDGIVDQMIRSPYCENSLWLNAFLTGYRVEKLLHKGLKDFDSKDGVGYVEMSDLEDYICKMKYTFGNIETSEFGRKQEAVGYYTSPTMADKKGFYCIRFRGSDGASRLNTPHSLIINGTFDSAVLQRFYDYVISELKTLQQYYNAGVIAELVKNPNKLYKNYHGKVVDGKLLFGGNGGLMRYFPSLFTYEINEKTTLNFNEYLQYLYQKEAVQKKNTDGFSYIREFIDHTLTDFSTNLDVWTTAINDMLMQMVDDEITQLSQSSTKKIVEFDKGELKNIAIPVQILRYYKQKYSEADKSDAYEGIVGDVSNSDIIRTAIANHVLSTSISIIEFEKVFAGDPAYYKRISSANGKVFTDNGVTYRIDNLVEKHSDKIKRLGSLLSPGQNLRFDFSDEATKELGIRNGDKYTVLNMADYKLKSEYINSHLIPRFTKQYIINILRTEGSIGDLQLTTDNIRNIYKFDGTVDELYSEFNIPADIRERINDLVKQQIEPYSGVTVSDAQVIIRPQFYRELRIRLGMWQFAPTYIKYVDETGAKKTTRYTDDIAYDLLENDKSWMDSAEKTAIVSNFEAQALKMTYFGNESTIIGEGQYQNVPLYNKMAIFTQFKWQSGSDIGNAVYERMNRPGQEIDMMAFESAVKVGLEQRIYTPYKSGKFAFDGLDKNSGKFLDQNGEVKSSNRKDVLNVRVQSMRNLRLQLNTEAHDATERSLGTQAQKLAYANVFDDDVLDRTDYLDEAGGKDVKDDMLNILNRLSEIKYESILSQFGSPQNAAKFIQNVILSNGLDDLSLDIIKNGGSAASLSSRDIFEQAVAAMLGRSIIDINTQGGTAIQQSEFGYDGLNSEDNEYDALNSGKHLVWSSEKNTMEVMLSINFFKNIIPESEQVTFARAKRWLINHDIISGIKDDGTASEPKPIGVGYRVPTQGQSSMFAFTVADILPPSSGDLIIVPREFTAQTGSDFDVDKLYISTLYFGNDGNVITDKTDENEIQYLVNRYIMRTMQILQSENMYFATHASIDVIVSKIKSEIVPLARQFNQSIGDKNIRELTPYFQSERKREFTSGKQGVAMFALAITNTAQTQVTHTAIKWRKARFGLFDLDCILSKDGSYVSDYLSAMLSSHVDVAKDPYIFDININNITYDTLCFILRSGAGEGAITFICQPAIKEFANRLLATNTVYGKNIKTKVRANSKRQLMKAVYDELMKSLQKDLYAALSAEGVSKEDALEMKKVAGELVESETEIDFSDVFDYQIGKRHLQNPNTAEAILFQMKALRAYKDLQSNVARLSKLVQVSRIDTKKYGNTIPLQLNFYHKYLELAFSSEGSHWKNTKGLSKDPIRYYFDKTGLGDNLQRVIDMMDIILKHQSFSATSLFKQIFSRMLAERNGMFKDSGGELHSRPDFDEKYLQNISRTINDLLRYVALVQYGSFFENKSGVTYDSSEYDTMIDPQDDNNIFNRVIRLQDDILSGKYGDRLVSDDGLILNSFIKSLIVTNQSGVKRVVLAQSPMDMSTAKKNQIVADYYNALIDKSEDIRQLAKDLAIYFYFNRYDTSSRSNMFSVVPMSARSQYDKAISYALHGDFDTVYNAEQITDVLFRNYWRDNSIVPELNLSSATSGTNTSIDDMKSTHTLYSVRIGTKKVPGVIISSYETAMYVKIHRGGSDYFLYKKVGDITIDEGEGKVYNKSVYRIYPKAGTVVENENVYEYDIIQHLASAYPENDLPSQFSPGIFDPEQIVTDFINTSKNPQKYSLDIRYRDEASQFNYSSPEQYANDRDKIAGDGNIAIVTKSKIERDTLGKYLQNVRRLEFGAQSDTAEWSGRARDVKVGKHTDIKSVVDAMMLKPDSRITVYLYGTIPTTRNTRAEINQYVKEQTARLSDMNLSEEEFNNHVAYLKQVANDMVTNQKRQDYVRNLFYEIQSRDVQIQAVATLQGEDCAGQVMRAVMDIVRDDPGFFSENTIPGWIYVSSNFYNKGQNQEYFDYFKTEASYDYYNVMTNEEEAIVDVETKLSNTADVITQSTDDLFNLLKAGDPLSAKIADTLEPIHDDQAEKSC